MNYSFKILEEPTNIELQMGVFNLMINTKYSR